MKQTIHTLLILFLFATVAVAGNPADTTILKPKAVYGKEAKAITYILDNNHYKKITLNDSLSSIIFDNYFLSLDNTKSYFLATDKKSFDSYRYKIDDLTREEDVRLAFEVYQVFRTRFVQRMDYVLNSLIPSNFDYTVDEYFETDRDKEPWAGSEAELNEIWRKTIKSQALSLKLAGKPANEIKTILKERYDRFSKNVSQFNSEDVFSLYMNAITEAYDPHTNYLSPRAADLFKQSMSLSLEGIGARLQTDDDYTRVAEIIVGGPADRSDLIKANDRIIAVGQGTDGALVDVVGWRIDEVVKLIKGPKGTSVRLQILPAETGVTGPAKIITIVRDKVKLEDQKAKKELIKYQQNGRDVKLGVITLPNFYIDFEAYQKQDPNYTSTTRDVAALIKELQAESIDGLVVDLRNNGGGSLSEAIDLTGLFIKNGPVVQVKSSNNKIDIYSDDDQSVLYTGPLVVLTNRFSASASEIFAGAIQDYNRGIVVGESTYGKGTVQTVLDLRRFIQDKEPVGELKITYQKFYRVTGSSTQHKGILPDINLPTALEPREFSESANISALPWDEIRGAFYNKTPYINSKLIGQLSKSSQNRFKSDPELVKFLNETDEFKTAAHITRISLNEANRRKELEAAEIRKNNKSMSSNGNSLKGIEKQSSQPALNQVKDQYLREGLFILSDLISNKIG